MSGHAANETTNDVLGYFHPDLDQGITELLESLRFLHICRLHKAVCPSLSSLLFIVLFIKSHILFLHILLVCTSYCFALFFILLHILLFISFFTYIYALVWCYFYIIFYSLHCPLSGPDLTYISLLIIPCIIYYVTNKETLTLTLRCNLAALDGPKHNIPEVFYWI